MIEGNRPSDGGVLGASRPATSSVAATIIQVWLRMLGSRESPTIIVMQVPTNITHSGSM